MLDKHRKAAEELNKIKDLVIEQLKGNVSEKQVADFILKEYKKRGMKSMDKPLVIVAAGKNTCDVHHSPKNFKIRDGPIMLDIWAKHKNGCFADLTWMFYKGKVDKEFAKDFVSLVRSRNKAITFLNSCLKDKYLPTMFEIDSISRAYLAEHRKGYAFQHRIGHMLGKVVHAGSRKEYYERLKLNTPYTIEPGIYFKPYGIRLENDFWIDSNFKLHLKNVQNKLISILYTY
jgi:Xaa-Pro aminopeptidase